MKLGIIGAGMIVNEFLSFVHELKEIEIVGICATKAGEEKVKALTKKHGIPSYYTDVEVMLSNKEMDTIYVASPNHLHYQHSKQALLANKNVICEKPFTSNIKELEELMTIQKHQNKILIEAVTTQYLPNTKKIQELLPTLGDIKIVTLNFSKYSSRYDAFKAGTILPAFNPEMSGGALMDINIYNINFVVALFGKPNKVDYLANIERNIDTSGILTLDYGHFKCVCIGAKDCKAPIMSTIQGDQGAVVIQTPVSMISDYQVLMNSDMIDTSSSDSATNRYTSQNKKHQMHYEFETFVDIIHNHKYDVMDKMLEISRITMEIQTKARNIAGIVFPADTL